MSRFDLSVYRELQRGVSRGSEGTRIWHHQLEQMKDEVSAEDPISLAKALSFLDLNEGPMPSWLFEVFAEVLCRLASEESKDYAASFRRTAIERNSARTDELRFFLVATCRSAQGKAGFPEDVIKIRFNPELCHQMIAQVLGEDYHGPGSSWDDAFELAALLSEKDGDPVACGFDAMKKAYSRHLNRLRSDDPGVKDPVGLYTASILGFAPLV